MHLDRQHIRAVFQFAGADRHDTLFLDGIGDRRGRAGGEPHRPARHARAADLRAVEVIHRAVIDNLVNRQRDLARVAAVREFFPKVVTKLAALVDAGPDSGIGQRGALQPQQAGAGLPRGIVVGRPAPRRAEVPVLVVVLPAVAVIDQHDAGGQVHLRARHRRLHTQRRVAARRAARPFAEGPVAPVVHHKVRVLQHQRVPCAICGDRPLAAVVVAQRANRHAVFIPHRDAAALVGQAARPRPKHLHARRNAVLLPEQPRLDVGQDDLLPMTEERVVRPVSVKRREIQLNVAPQFPAGNVKRRGGDIGQLDPLRRIAAWIVHDLVDHDLLRPHAARRPHSPSDGCSK